MFSKTLFLLSLLLTSTYCYTEEEDVVVMTTANFEEIIKGNDYVLAEFYAPWCGHCKSLAPEYAKAAKALKEKGAILGKIDATVEKELGEKYGVSGYPTLKFFLKGEPMEYEGGRTATDIISWVQKKTGDAIETVETSERLEELKRDNDVVIVYYGATFSEEFKKVALIEEDGAFIQIFKADIDADVKRPSIKLYKHFDEKVNVLEKEITSENITEFINENAYPTVMIFDDKAIKKIFQQQSPAFFMFVDPKNENAEASEKTFAEVAQINKGGKIVFTTSHPEDDSGHYEKLAEYIGADLTNTPALILCDFNIETQEMNKYRYTEELTKDNMTAFVEKYKKGELKKYLKSQEPQPNDGNVEVFTGSDYQKRAVESDQDVLVEFYAPWCGHCKQLAPIYEAVAAKLADIKTIVIAKVDSTANEVAGVPIEGFPTIIFYPAGQTESINFDGDRTEAGILKWLKEHVKHSLGDIEIPEEVKEEPTPEEAKEAQDL